MADNDEPIVQGALPTEVLLPLVDDTAALERSCGKAVFIHAMGGVRRPRPLEQTMGFRPASVLSGEADLDGAATGSSRLFVVPIVRKKATISSPVITVGRAPSNDIIIADITLSKLHAFIRESADGHLLEDAGSKNGTFVDGSPVPQRGSSKPGHGTPLQAATTVRFGSVNLTYVPTAQLGAFLRFAASGMA